MSRILALAGAVAFFASAAQAADIASVTVSTDGKSAAQINDEIRQAASRVCTTVLNDSAWSMHYLHVSCVRHAVAQADAQIAQLSGGQTLASATPR